MNQQFHSPFFFLSKLPDKYFESLRYLCQNNVLLADFILPQINNKKLLVFFRSVQENFYKSEIPLILRWSIHCFSDRFANSTFNENDYKDLYLFFLNQVNDDSLNDILSIIKESKKDIILKDSPEIRNMGFYLLLFKESYPALFSVFRPKFDRLISIITPDYLLAILGIPSLSLFRECPQKTIDSYDFEPHSIIEVLDETCEPNILNSIQNRIVDLFQYPNNYPDIPNSDAQSFLNTSIRKKKHIFDVLANLFYGSLNDFQLEKVPMLMRVSPVVVPYLILAYQPLIYQNFDKYYRLIAASLPKSPAQKIQELMQKDYQIIKLINFLSGKELTIKDLLDHTLPYHLQFVLHQKQLLDFRNFFGFVYSEKDWEHDYEFIYFYNAIRAMMDLAIISVNSQDDWMKKLQSLQQFMKLIKSPDILEKLTIDLFSILFLQRKGKFYFSKTIANIILQILIRYNPKNNYFKMGQMSLQTQNKGENISEYFGANRSSILHAVSEKKWNDAMMLAQVSDKYRKIFILGYSIYLLCMNMMSPINCSEFQKEFNIEVGFSTYLIEDSLNFARSDYIQFEPIIEKRINTSKSDILDPIPNREKWQPIMSIVRNITPSYVDVIDPKEFDMIFTQTHYFKALIENLKLFQKCFLLSSKLSVFTEDDSTIIPLTAINILNGPINSCNFDLAENVAKIIHVNLFELVLNNLQVFNITPSFIEAFNKKHPIECSVLAMTKLNKNEISELSHDVNVINTRQFLIKQNSSSIDNEEDVLFMTAVTALENTGTSIDFYDDILFRIDHSKFCNALLKKIDKVPEDTALYLLDIVGYTMNEKAKEKYKSFFIKIKIQKAIKEISLKDSKAVISKLIEMKKIKLLANYIEFCLSTKYETIINVTKVFKSRRAIKKFLSFFPQYYVHLLKIGDDDLISILLELRKDNEFTSFAHLPKEIRQNSDISSTDSIVEAFEKNPSLISQINKDISNLLNCDQLLQIMKNASDSEFIQIFDTFRHVFNNNSIATDYLKSKFNKKVDSIVVNDILSEKKALINLISIHSFLISTNFFQTEEKFTKKIEALYQFVSNRPFLKTKIPYKFSNDDYTNILKILFLQDININLSYEICDLFDLNALDFMLQRAYIPNSLYQLHIVQEMFQDYLNRYSSQTIDFTHFNFKTSPYAKCDLLNNNSPFLLPYQKASFFNPDAINIIIQMGIESLTPNASPAPLQIYQECQFSYKRNRTKPRAPNQREVQTCLLFIRRYGSNECNLRMSVYFDDFDNILPNLMMIDNIEHQHNLFIHDVYEPAVLRNVYPQIFKAINTFRQNEPLVEKLWEVLIAYLDQKGLLYSLEFCYSELNRLDDLGHVYVKLFRNSNEITKKVYYINNAYANFKKALKDGIVLHENEKSIRLYKKLSKLQKSICEFVLENGLNNLKESIDIINDDDADAYAGSLIMKYCHDVQRRNKIIEHICSLKKIHIKNIISKLCSNYKDATLDELKDFLQSVKSEPCYLEYYLEQILQLVSKSENSFHFIPSLIYFSVDSDELKVMLFIEYDFLVEAFTLLSLQFENQKLTQYFPLIAHRASLLGIDDIVENICKLMK